MYNYAKRCIGTNWLVAMKNIWQWDTFLRTHYYETNDGWSVIVILWRNELLGKLKRFAKGSNHHCLLEHNKEYCILYPYIDSILVICINTLGCVSLSSYSNQMYDPRNMFIHLLDGFIRLPVSGCFFFLYGSVGDDFHVWMATLLPHSFNTKNFHSILTLSCQVQLHSTCQSILPSFHR